MAEVNINPFGYDNYRELKKDIRNTDDENGLRLGSPRNEHSNASIFSLDDNEVTKDDFMDRLDEIGLNDDIASAMWEILNVDSDGDSEDILDENELDELIETYGKGADEDDSVSLRSFLKNLGKEESVDEKDEDDDDSVKSEKTKDDKTSSSETKTSSETNTNTSTNVDSQGFLTVSMDESDKEKYSTDKINKDKKTVLDTKEQIDKALEKIKNGEEDPSSTDNINGIVNYNIEVGKNKRAIVRYENGKLVSAGIVKQNRDGNDEYLAHSTFDDSGKMNSFCLDKDNSGKAEKYAAFDAEGNLSAIYYDNNESGMSEAGAMFKDGKLVSLKMSSEDNGKFDKEFEVNSDGKYEQGYKLDDNGNKIQQQPQVQEQTVQNIQTATQTSPQTPVQSGGSSAGQTRTVSQTQSSSQAGDSQQTTQTASNEPDAVERAMKRDSEILSKGQKFNDSAGNLEYVVYNGIVYNSNGTISTKMEYKNGKIVPRVQPNKGDKTLTDLKRQEREQLEAAKKDSAPKYDWKRVCNKYGVDSTSPMGLALINPGSIVDKKTTTAGQEVYVINGVSYNKDGSKALNLGFNFK